MAKPLALTLSIATAALVTALILAVFTLIAFPQTRRDMAATNITAAKDHGGVFVYITEQHGGYYLTIYRQSPLAARFALQTDRQFDGNFITAVEGADGVYVVEITHGAIDFVYFSPRTIDLRHIALLASCIIFATATYKLLLRKSAKP